MSHITPEDARSLMDSCPVRLAGCSCRYFPIDEKYGLKTYYSEQDRDHCFQMQSELSALGFSPAVGDKLDIMSPDGESEQYAYVTESVTKTLRQASCEYAGGTPDPEAYNFYDNVDWQKEDEFIARYHDEFEQLKSDMKEAGYRDCDDHVSNYGFLPNGKLVAIDMDNVFKFVTGNECFE